jgi:hypothetical protein
MLANNMLAKELHGRKHGRQLQKKSRTNEVIRGIKRELTEDAHAWRASCIDIPHTRYGKEDAFALAGLHHACECIGKYCKLGSPRIIGTPPHILLVPS